MRVEDSGRCVCYEGMFYNCEFKQQESPEAVDSRDSLSQKIEDFQDDESVFRTTRAPVGRVLASSGFADSRAPFSPARPEKLHRVGLKGAGRFLAVYNLGGKH